MFLPVGLGGLSPLMQPIAVLEERLQSLDGVELPFNVVLARFFPNGLSYPAAQCRALALGDGTVAIFFSGGRTS